MCTEVSPGRKELAVQHVNTHASRGVPFGSAEREKEKGVHTSVIYLFCFTSFSKRNEYFVRQTRGTGPYGWPFKSLVCRFWTRIQWYAFEGRGEGWLEGSNLI